MSFQVLFFFYFCQVVAHWTDLNLPTFQTATGKCRENIPLIIEAVKAHNEALLAAQREAERLKEEHLKQELERLNAEGLY